MNKKKYLTLGVLSALAISTATAQQSNSSSVHSSQSKTERSNPSISKIKAILEEKKISDHNVDARVSTVNNNVVLMFTMPSNSLIVSIVDINNHKVITEPIPNELKYFSLNTAFLEAGKYSMLIEDSKGLIRNSYILTITNN